MACEIIDVVEFLLSGKFSIQSFFTDFLLHLLQIGLFECDFHIS